MTGLDEEVANSLRKSGKPVVLCVNKVEDQDQAWQMVGEFYGLGLGDPIFVSAAWAQCGRPFGRSGKAL